jgi:hypothetical protein
MRVFNGIGETRKVEMTQELSSQKMQRRYGNMDRVRSLVCSDRRLSVRQRAEELNLFGGNDANSGLGKRILQYVNAPARNALKLLEFLAKKSFIKNHPYALAT